MGLYVQELSRLQQAQGSMEEEHRTNVADLMASVEAMRRALADQRDDADKALQRAQRTSEEEVSSLKARLAAVTGKRLASSQACTQVPDGIMMGGDGQHLHVALAASDGFYFTIGDLS